MTTERDDEKFAQLADAIGPFLDRVVIVGGWAHRLLRLHSLAQALPYAPLMTRDTDVAIPPGMRIDEGSLRERLLARGFTEEFSGDDRPPVTHYQLGGDDAGFYAEFLTPLAGSELRRDGTRDVTTSVSGVSAQNLRYLDVLLIAPWSVTPDSVGAPMKVMIALNIPSDLTRAEAERLSQFVRMLAIARSRRAGGRRARSPIRGTWWA